MCFSRDAAGAVAALFQADSVKCTWLFQKPATMVFSSAIDDAGIFRNLDFATFGNCDDLASRSEHDRIVKRSSVGRGVDRGADERQSASVIRHGWQWR